MSVLPTVRYVAETRYVEGRTSLVSEGVIGVCAGRSGFPALRMVNWVPQLSSVYIHPSV